MSQLTKNQRRFELGRLPSQPEQAKAITVLRSGKIVPKVTAPQKLTDILLVAKSSRAQNEEKIPKSEEELKQ